jgi:hypothetical protein
LRNATGSYLSSRNELFQTQLDQLDRLTEGWVADHLQKGKTSKKDKELVTLESIGFSDEFIFEAVEDPRRGLCQ